MFFDTISKASAFMFTFSLREGARFFEPPFEFSSSSLLPALLFSPFSLLLYPFSFIPGALSKPLGGVWKKPPFQAPKALI